MRWGLIIDSISSMGNSKQLLYPQAMGRLWEVFSGWVVVEDVAGVI